MKNAKLLILFTAMLSAIFISGCKKDNDDPQPGQNAQEYHLKKVTIPDAMAQSNDPGAQMAVAYIDMVNGMASYSSMMTPPGKSSKMNYKDDGETYTWEVDDVSGTYTVTLKIRKTDYKTFWEMYITGTLDGHQLTNFKYIEAIQLNDGSGSTFTIYDLDTGQWYMDITWTDDGNGNFDLTFTVFEEMKLYISVSSDGSGWLEYSEWIMSAYQVTYKASWEASGHGQWWQYDNGVPTDQGTW
jgi:hypothetical protein